MPGWATHRLHHILGFLRGALHEALQALLRSPDEALHLARRPVEVALQPALVNPRRQLLHALLHALGRILDRFLGVVRKLPRLPWNHTITSHQDPPLHHEIYIHPQICRALLIWSPQSHARTSSGRLPLVAPCSGCRVARAGSRAEHLVQALAHALRRAVHAALQRVRGVVHRPARVVHILLRAIHSLLRGLRCLVHALRGVHPMSLTWRQRAWAAAVRPRVCSVAQLSKPLEWSSCGARTQLSCNRAVCASEERPTCSSVPEVPAGAAPPASACASCAARLCAAAEASITPPSVDWLPDPAPAPPRVLVSKVPPSVDGPLTPALPVDVADVSMTPPSVDWLPDSVPAPPPVPVVASNAPPSVESASFRCFAGVFLRPAAPPSPALHATCAPPLRPMLWDAETHNYCHHCWSQEETPASMFIWLAKHQGQFLQSDEPGRLGRYGHKQGGGKAVGSPLPAGKALPQADSMVHPPLAPT